ncbi:hypothetical protein MMPV_005088 [Pyropia vietnamensis]
MPDVTFRLHAPLPPTDTYLRVIGGHPALGNWSPATAPSLVPTPNGDDDAVSTVTVSLPPGEAVLEYKYARVDAAAGTVTWEGGDNRRLEVGPEGAAVDCHWKGGESPTLPCEGIVVPPPPAAPVEAAPVEAAPVEAAPVEAEPPSANDEVSSLANTPAAPAVDAAGLVIDASTPPAGGSPPSSSNDASVEAPAPLVSAPAPPADALATPADPPVPSPRMSEEPEAGEAPPAPAAPAGADAQALRAHDDSAALGAGSTTDSGGGEAEVGADKRGGDANIFKHLSSGVSSLLRAMSRRDGGRGRRDSNSRQPANGVAHAES